MLTPIETEDNVALAKTLIAILLPLGQNAFQADNNGHYNFFINDRT